MKGSGRILALGLPMLLLSVPAWAADGAEPGFGLSWGVPLLTLIASIVALVFAHQFYKKVYAAPAGTDKMIEIANHVKEGAYAYLFRQYKVVTVAFIILVVILTVLAYQGIQKPFVPLAFLTGGFFSALSGFLGMKTAAMASSRTAQGASEGLNRGLQVAFRSGAVMGLVVVGFGLLYIVLWYLLLDKVIYSAHHMREGLSIFGLTLVHPGMPQEEKLFDIALTMITFGMGASTQALFARVGGGIYTKAADVGADLVGKVEAGIPEDDPRNPATIADNVGDYVGDVAGMGADLYESYTGSILATITLGAALSFLTELPGNLTPLKAVLAPMLVAGIGILMSIAGIFLVKCEEGASQKQLLRALLKGTLASSLLILVAMVVLVLTGFMTWGIFGAVVAGLAAGVIIGQITEYYTSDEFKPTRGIAEHAEMGHGTLLIEGFSVGMISTGWSVVTIVLGIVFAFSLAGGFTDIALGLYGIGFAAVGMLSTLGITLATDAYGPIADNAGGNAEMSGLGEEVRNRTDALDALGNTTAATGKGFAIGSAALTAMALMAAYLEEIRSWIRALILETEAGIAGVYEIGNKVFTYDSVTTASVMDFVEAYNLTIMNPRLIGGVFIGAMMCFVFCALLIKAVGRAAGAMVNEVRTQFREKPGIMEGTEMPDYARCVSISTAGAQREMIVPSILAIVVPIATGLLLDVAGVLGLLAGVLTTGFSLAITLNNSGGAWDNAKKYIEKGHIGGKGSDAHKAAVVGDTVGDPFKDTAGPSLNILIKLMMMVSVVFCGVVVKYGSVVGGWFGMGN